MNEKPDVSAKEFGAMQAKVEYIREGVDRHTIMLERIETALQKNVTQAYLEKYIKKHEKESEEKYVKKSDIKGLLDIWKALTSTAAKIIASVIIIFILYVGGSAITHNSTANTKGLDMDKIKEVIR